MQNRLLKSLKKAVILSGIVGLGLLSGTSRLHAQATWTSQTTGGDWATAGNWTGTAPANDGTTALTFDTATANRVYTNTLTNFTASSITVSANSKDNNVTGNQINLGGTFTVNTGNWQTFGIAMSLAAVRTFAINNGQLTLSGDLTGASGGISKSGGGKLIISGSNSIGAAERLLISSASTVELTSTNALGAAATGTGTVSGQNGNGYITFANSVAAELSLKSDTAINSYGLNAGSSSTGGTVTLGRATSGAGYVQNFAFASIGSRTMTFNQGSNVSSGYMTANIGNVGLSAGNNDRVVTFNGSAAISLGDVATTANAGNNRRLGLAGTNANNAVTGVISNLAAGVTGTSLLSLIKSDSSTWTLTGANTYTGITTIAGGTLQLGNGGATGTLNPASAIQNGGTLAFNRTGTITQGTDFAGTISAYATDYSTNAAGVALGTPVLGKLVKSASGNLILNGSNTLAASDSFTFSGASSGTVTLKNTAALGAAGNTVRFSGGGSGNVDIQSDTLNAYNFGSGSFNGGTITLTGTTGATTAGYTLGTLDLSSVTMTLNRGGAVTSGTASFTELKMTGGNDNNPVTLAGDATWIVGSASITSTGISKRLQLDGSSAGNVMAGAISDTNNATAGAKVNLIKANTSTWTLNGTNTYTGTTAVNGGTLKAGSTQAFGSNSAVTMANTSSAILDLNNYSNSIGSLTGGGASGGNVLLGSGTLTIGADNTSPAAYAGVISGSGGALIKTGSGTLSLSGQNTYSGGTVVSNGTLNLNAGNSGTGVIRGTVNVNSGATLLSSVHDSFGYNSGVKVDTINLVGGTLTHSSNDTLTISSATVNMTGGLMSATGGGSSAFDLYNNGSGATAINTLASSGTATISGKLNLRNGAGATTVFTVADGAAVTDLLVSGVIADGPTEGTGSKIQKSGAGTLLLGSSNSYSGGTTIKNGVLVVGNDNALSGGTLTLDGGSLQSNNDTISLSNPISVTTVGGTVSGDTDLKLTGSASGTGTLTVNMNSSKTLTVAPTVPNSFGDANTTIKVTQGTLLLGGSNVIGNSTAINLAGGTFNTGGKDETVGALTLSGSSTIDLGGAGKMYFVDSSSQTWSGTLSILNWAGNVNGAGANQLFFGSSAGALGSGSYTINIYGSGATFLGTGSLLTTGELVPVPEPATIIGAFVFVGLIVLRERRRLACLLGRKCQMQPIRVPLSRKNSR